jgi:hypothetical protein
LTQSIVGGTPSIELKSLSPVSGFDFLSLQAPYH